MDSDERRNRRIVDYLNDGEELGIEGPAVTPRSSSAGAVAAARSLLPRFRWARLAKLGRKGAGRKGMGKGKEVEVSAEKAEHKPMVASVPAREGDSDVTRPPPDVGVGVSLVFLLAKTSDEFNKMVKVRAEMETLLKEIKDQVRNSADGAGDDDASKPPCNLDSTATSSCLTDGNDRVANVQSEDHATSSGVEVARCSAKSSPEDGCCVGVDVLKEEFHAELERLHVNYGSDTPPFLPEEQDAELLDDDIAEYRQGFDDDSGEIVEDEDEEDDDHDHDAEYSGVSARELERRLHELLHQRNQERIEELEAALWRAEKKLLEKEMEACLWNDTAKLALRQDNESQ